MLVFSSLAFLLGVVSSLLEVYSFDPSSYLVFIQEFIATGPAFLISCICLSVAFLCEFFNFTLPRFLSAIIRAYLNVGIEVGILSSLTTFFLGLGALVSFYIFGSHEQILISVELIEYGTWFMLVWLPFIFARKVYLGCKDKAMYYFPVVNLFVCVLILIYTDLFGFNKYFLTALGLVTMMYFLFKLKEGYAEYFSVQYK
ncbi:hypothetical protein F8A90_13655 [Cobetia sp. cqz5-12]|uniref:hypothetical protein n=1 Tax=Cobetia sp. cqz5-12 TaxID=2609415 RepID=UPI001903C100|nr:hypothetical protein [Cobetia sp. cqz5-12]QQK65047.1 hypothetical protein F8A90_13655 [Cobetia sp. cqz5-12]